ncbi:tripartite tricarboxylate transporter TctB family protein [Phytohalomonas tamaricis]|uniref:tripartite tricarboxylate transporter TctB family protein n=1 Tax=Phytohalomonas tamaricis TaxID=2081032 RepID=UPI000D0AC48C|nr:tripartite tricarboxylate transporter TctB family protein [Phytohalomonas tamaricis]
MTRLGDRLLGMILLVLAAVYAASTTQMEVPFSYDPLGPKGFPFVLAALLVVLAVVLLLRPALGEPWPRGVLLAKRGVLLAKVVAVLVVLTLYALAFSSLGYLLSSALAIFALAWLFNAGSLKALVCAVAMALGSYALFVYALDISLPVGQLFGGR